MTYDPKQHHRRSIRWFGYDYAEAGAYFVTLCVEGHLCLFGEIVGDAMRMNEAGCMVQTTWDELPGHYPGVETDAFVVMPNHIHGIIRLCERPVGAGPRACPASEVSVRTGRKGQPRGAAPTRIDGRGATGALSLGDVVQRFKMLTTKRYANGVRQQGWPVFRGRLWQRNYYEHVIRGEESLNRIRRYIADNPASWAFDEENPQARETRPNGS
jgi:putative transposase